jgi:hypothetical protein
MEHPEAVEQLDRQSSVLVDVDAVLAFVDRFHRPLEEVRWVLDIVKELLLLVVRSDMALSQRLLQVANLDLWHTSSPESFVKPLIAVVKVSLVRHRNRQRGTGASVPPPSGATPTWLGLGAGHSLDLPFFFKFFGHMSDLFLKLLNLLVSINQSRTANTPEGICVVRMVQFVIQFTNPINHLENVVRHPIVLLTSGLFLNTVQVEVKPLKGHN